MKKPRECDTCEFKRDESVTDDGRRIVDCSANERQLYMPYADDCKHWQKRAEID